MNYSELSAAIREWLENEETAFVAEIDRFIRLGERRIYTFLKLPEVRKNREGNATADNRYLSIDPDVIRVLALHVVNGSGEYTGLLLKDEGFIREAYPDPTATGEPRYYSVFDHNTLLLGPTPDSNYTMEITYHGVPNSIVDAGTTWLGDNFEQLLLYACLAEGYIFMKGEPDLIAKYEERYQAEVKNVGLVAVRAAYMSDEVRPEV